MEATAHNEPEPCKACGTCPTCGRGGVFDWTWRPPYYGPYYYEPVPWWQGPVSMYGTTTTQPQAVFSN